MGSGSTLPGLLAETVDRHIASKLAAKVKYGSIIVTGTNGKTTTSKMLVEILKEDGLTVLANDSGSNMMRGVTSALVNATDIFGFRVKADVAVFEVDEATMPEATSKIRPEILLVSNLFRDQLDRYGELDKTAALIGKSLQGFSKMTTVLNADDPLVASLSKYADGPVEYFGVESTEIATTSKVAMDSKDCLECGHELFYKNRYFGHLGIWECHNCGAKRPVPKYKAENIKLTAENSEFELALPKEKVKVNLATPGLYNVYNALAAATVAELAEAGGAPIAHALNDFSAAFGRMETLEIKNKKAMLLLVKNPTGANQAFAAVYSDNAPKNIVFALNDNFADGTDVSWIWDIDFENLDLSKTKVIASGIRAEDIALRFKYAGLKKDQIEIEKDVVVAIEKMASSAAKEEKIYIFPTYTAMVEARSAFAGEDDKLAKLGKVTKRGL